jgi:hypothetical protein
MVPIPPVWNLDVYQPFARTLHYVRAMQCKIAMHSSEMCWQGETILLALRTFLFCRLENSSGRIILQE